MRKLEKTFANCGCMLRCIAVPLTGGSFHAQVEIMRYEDEALLVTKAFVPPEAFRSSTQAIECTRAWSVDWVRQNC
jgi:hypothetical protein